MVKERREKLESLGFTWQVRNRPEWEQRFQELMEYKAIHGDCKVPQHYKDNKALGKWVAKQREQYKLKKKGQHSFLTPDRQEKLEQEGFLWSLRSVGATASASPAQTMTMTPATKPNLKTESQPHPDGPPMNLIVTKQPPIDNQVDNLPASVPAVSVVNTKGKPC